MNRKVFLTAITAALVFAASCGTEDGDDSAIVQEPTKESVTQTESQKEEVSVATTRPIVIRATKGQSLSKVSSSDGYSLTFEATDKLSLKYADNTECITLDMDGDGAGQTTATFKGNIPTAADNKELYAEIGSALSGVASSTTSLADLVSNNCYMKSANFTYDPSNEINDVTLGDQNAYIAISLSPFSKVTSVKVNDGEPIALSEYKQVWVAVNGGTSVSIGELSVSDKKTEAGKIYKVIRNAFSVSATRKVHFSTGNLQATTSDNGANWTWGFAENQYDRIGGATANTAINGDGTVSENGTVDLFGWVGKTSEWDGAAMYGISNSTTLDDYTYGTDSEFLKSDWGNVPGIGSGWRTLTGGDGGEWDYLLNIRTTTSGIRYAHANVNGVNGLVIVPDDWSEETYNLQSTNTTKAVYSTNIISESDWNNTLQPAGVVFLPAAGERFGSSLPYAAVYVGRYWSSSSSAYSNNAYYLSFSEDNIRPAESIQRSYGHSVRLVRDLK